jgi:predicted dehydrogenase
VTRLAVVGLGYWGPNLARNFDRLPDAELAWVSDSSEEALARWAPAFPDARATPDLAEVLVDASLDAVVVATPVSTHAELALRVLEAGKHCFVEKPLAQSAPEAEQVVEAAGDRVLMVGHLLEYHPGIMRLKQLIDSGDLGDVRYVYSNRLNLGVLRTSENALWSLGAHDVSVMLRLAGEEPLECRAVGESYVHEGVEDVVFAYLRFSSGLAAHMHLSWLDPHKERRFTVVGSKRMATFDDMEVERKLTVYDKGFDEDFSSYGEYIARSGDTHSYQVSNEEPLRIECRHFLDCVRDGSEPRSGGPSGLRVVRVLEALQQSLEASSRAAAV